MSLFGDNGPTSYLGTIEIGKIQNAGHDPCDSARRLFADLSTPELAWAAEDGGWPEPLWRAVEEAGYPDAPPPPAGVMEATTVPGAAGHHRR